MLVDSTFFDKRDIVKHQKIHIGEKPFVCTICVEGFLERRKLLRHKKRINVCKKPLKCDICDKQFSSKASILKHIKSHW
jgi:KRAB domain-containing zinc finger protein